MSATTTLRQAAPDSGEAELQVRPKVGSRSRPSSKTGRGPGPLARPARVVRAPRLRSAPSMPVHGCAVQSLGHAMELAGCPAEDVSASLRLTRVQAGVRLTERGIAVVLVTGLMIVLAAVTVVGLTAVRVTGDRAQPLPASYAAQP
jgi:hypothetical protein